MIRCRDVCKIYQQGENEITALAGVSLEIPAGSFAAVMGQSGSGKSTLLHLIGGLERPTSGELLVDGRTHIGFVFQFFNLLPTLTAMENVAMPFVLDGRAKSEADERAAVLLTKVGLDKRKDHLPEELSGGEIQRVAIARALSFRPPLLLADEPTGNLDSKNGTAILDLLRQINQEDGCTVVIVTHSEEAASYADRKIYLRDGRLEV
jgi:putative ABC transport system ATP-binding protein